MPERKKKRFYENREMFSPQAARDRLHLEEEPLWTTLAEPTWEKMVCSQEAK